MSLTPRLLPGFVRCPIRHSRHPRLRLEKNVARRTYTKDVKLRYVVCLDVRLYASWERLSP